MTEYPMYSPHKPAKLFKGFVFTKDDDKETQLINFVNYKAFKWVEDYRIEKGTRQPMPWLLIADGIATIKTNSLLDIEVNDIVELEHPALRGKKYFSVTGSPQIDGMYVPKWRQTYQRLTLKFSDLKEVNRNVGTVEG
jgi:hypothetical protein